MKREAQTDETGKTRGTCRLLGGAAILFLKICMLAIALYLAYEGAAYSYYSSTDYGQRIYEVPDSVRGNLLVFAGACILSALVSAAIGTWKKLADHQERVCKLVLFFACVWMLVTGFLYIREHPYYPSGDQLATTAGAAYAREGNFSMFSKGGYIGMFEQQKGVLFLYEILFALFGDFRYDVTPKVHLFLGILTLAAGYSFLRITAKKPLYRILYCVMMMLCAPWLIHLPYVYGDLPSICFSMALFWALAAYGRSLQKRYLAIGAVAAALALLSRMHVWIALIGVLIGMLVLALEKERLRPILAGLCIVLAAWGAVKAVDWQYEYRSGYESGVGIPSILWIAMGLQETNGSPGIYNRYPQTMFEQCGFEREPATEIGREYIRERLLELRGNPDYARNFFETKIKMQWLEPLFEGLYSTHSFKDEGEGIPEGIESLYYGPLHDTVWKFANYYQSVVYLAVLAFVAISLLSRRECLPGSAGWIPLIAVVGGFLFSLAWESQCRYMLPYFMYLLPYASIGIGRIAEWIGGFWHRDKESGSSL